MRDRLQTNATESIQELSSTSTPITNHIETKLTFSLSWAAIQVFNGEPYVTLVDVQLILKFILRSVFLTNYDVPKFGYDSFIITIY